MMTKTKTFRNRHHRRLENADQKATQTEDEVAEPEEGKRQIIREKNPLKTQGLCIKQTKDAEGIHNFQQTNDGKVILNHRGHPLCFYCGIPSHQRSACRLRLRDVETASKDLSTPLEAVYHPEIN